MSRNGREEFFDSNTMRQQQHLHHYHQQMMHQQHIMGMQHWMHQQHLYQWQMQQQMRPFPENNADNGEGSSRNIMMMMPMPMPVPRYKHTTLDRLTKAVMPYVEVQYLSVECNGGKPGTPFYSLGALWESYNQWSAYGAGVPLLLNGKDLTDQYYVPFLSGIQLYTEPSKDSSQQIKLPSEESDSKSPSETGGSSAVADNPRSLVYEFLESESPHLRRPLADKISLLVSKNPELTTYRSCDLLPESWMCVAWYPIYRIPLGPTMKDLEASFLTFHALSTHCKGNRFSPLLHPAYTRRIHGGRFDPTDKISLPVFALASYKLRGSLVGPCGSNEHNQEDGLWVTADEWLKGLQARLPDYDFFRSHYRK